MWPLGCGQDKKGGIGRKGNSYKVLWVMARTLVLSEVESY